MKMIAMMSILFIEAIDNFKRIYREVRVKLSKFFSECSKISREIGYILERCGFGQCFGQSS